VFSRPSKSFRLFLAPGILLGVFAPALAQSPATETPTRGPVLKAEVRVVLVDVVVTQKKDKPAPDLRREDFEIYEDGRPQTISFFEEHKPTPPPPAPAPTAPSLPSVFTNVQQVHATDSLNVILLDWLNTQPQDRAYAQSQIAQYLHHVPPGTSIAAFVLGSHLQMVEGFTSDQVKLLAALDTQKKGAAEHSSSLLTSGSQDAAERQMVDTMVMMQMAPAGLEAVRDDQSATNTENTARRVNLTLQAMQELGHYLSGLPGRKNVIWFSAAFPINLFPGHEIAPQYSQALKRTTDLLAESRVSIYPVSTTGLTPGLSLDPQGQSFQPNQTPGNTNDANQLAMDALAEGTGGKAFYNTNAIGGALAHAVDIGSHYYTLTYSPFNNKMDGKFRKIEVKVRRRGYKVACREGYYASDANSPAAPAEHNSTVALARMVRFGMPDVAQIPYTVRISATNLPPSVDSAAKFGPRTPLRRYRLDFAIPLDALSVESSPDGEYRDALSLLIAAYDFEGKLLKVTSRRVYVTLPLVDYARARQEGLQLHDEIETPRGDLYLRTGLSEVNSSNVGTLGIPMSEAAATAALQSPPPANGSAELSSVPLSSLPPADPAFAPAPADLPPISAHAPGLSALPPDPTDPSSAPVVGPPCRLQDVLPKVAVHVKEFVEDMNHFTATELVEEERLAADGRPYSRLHNRADYVVSILNAGEGNYSVKEFRNVTEGGKNVRAGLSANGAPALALIFHPTHLEEFDMSCGDLVSFDGRKAWEVHFRQRKDRPVTITNFMDGHRLYDVLLSGTAWIDSANYQLVHLNADLLQPIPEAKLNLLHQSIDYGAVSFKARHTTLWLPKSAVVIADFRGERLRERRTYSDFQLFAVETGEKIAAPKEPPAEPSPK